MNIAILDDYQDVVRRLDCFRLLDGHAVKVFTNSARGLGQLSIRLASFQALVLLGERTRLPRALLERLPNLKLVVQAGPPGAAIDCQAAAERGIAIIEGTGDARAPAELTWALVLAARRKLLPYATNLQQGLWQTSSLIPERNIPGQGLHGKTLGIWGYGNVGRLVAGYGQAFGMRVVVWGSESSRDRARQQGLVAAASKQAFFGEADIVSLHLRLTDATRGCVRSEDLACMGADALLVNTSHAQLVEAGALEAALEQGRPAAAALDVFDSEPLAPGAPLLQRENLLATPHIGHVERDAMERHCRAAFGAIRDFAAGRLPGTDCGESLP